MTIAESVMSVCARVRAAGVVLGRTLLGRDC